MLDCYQESDVVQGRVTKVVTFGAFVEILPGVEGLVHISELAQHHVENPREVVSQGDVVNVKIIEVDAERRRLSLSLKRVEEGEEPQPPTGGGETLRPTDRPLRERLRRRVGCAAPTPTRPERAEVAEPTRSRRRRHLPSPRPSPSPTQPEAGPSPRPSRSRRRAEPRPRRAEAAEAEAEPEAAAEADEPQAAAPADEPE